MAPPLTPERAALRDQIIADFNKGDCTYADLSTKYGVNTKTLQSWFWWARKQGIHVRQYTGIERTEVMRQGIVNARRLRVESAPATGMTVASCLHCSAIVVPTQKERRPYRCSICRAARVETVIASRRSAA